MDVELSTQDLVTGQLQLGKRPAVIAVDLSNGFAQPSSPLGGDFTQVLAANTLLFEAAQKKDIPIFFSTVVYDNPEQASVFRQRLPVLNILERGSEWVDIHPDVTRFVAPNSIIEKHHPSAFFGTQLLDSLHALNIDSLIITGLTTSGCVRATCVDGLQHNYACTVVADACGDRNNEAHSMSLHDMHAKYAQVLSLDDTLKWLTCIS
jgi:maleamate amidohydrolase